MKINENIFTLDYGVKYLSKFFNNKLLLYISVVEETTVDSELIKDFFIENLFPLNARRELEVLKIIAACEPFITLYDLEEEEKVKKIVNLAYKTYRDKIYAAMYKDGVCREEST